MTTMDKLCKTLWGLIDNREDMKIIFSVYREDSISNNSRVKLILHYMKTHNLLPFKKVVKIKSDKSSDKSIEYRNSGNTLYAKKDWMGALSYYTQSIAAAPYPTTDDDDSNKLAVAFANRSAVLFAMTKYEACLSDIENALKFDYPDYLIYKLMERRGKCFQHLGKFSGASKCIQKSIDYLPLASSLSKAAIDQTLKRLETLYIENVSKSKSGPDLEPEPTTAQTSQPTDKAPDFIGSVEIKFKEETGRYIVAGRDFMPGELIVAENPYVAMLVPGYFSTHCFNCLRRFHALIPCKTCSLAMFCTEKCYEEAWESFHRIECPVLSKLLALDMGLDWMLALRLLLVASHKSNGLSCFLEKIDKLNDIDIVTDSASFNNLLASDPSFSTIHSLVHNFGKRTYAQVLKLTVAIICIVNCLDAYTDIFSFKTKEDASSSGDKHSPDPRIVTGGLLLQYIQCVQCNSYSIAELLFNMKQEDVVHTITMGGAIYKFASIINHSCSPNVLRSNYSGSSLSIIAFLPIKKGEEICCDYGHQFGNTDRATRKAALLQNYFFDCKCEACKNDWPLADNLDAHNPTFLCPKCKAPLAEEKNPASLSEYGNLVCSLCKKKVSYSQMWEKYKPLMDCYFSVKGDLLAGRSHNFTADLRRLVVTLNSLVQKPSKLLLDVQDAFLHCAMQMGNFYHTF